MLNWICLIINCNFCFSFFQSKASDTHNVYLWRFVNLWAALQYVSVNAVFPLLCVESKGIQLIKGVLCPRCWNKKITLVCYCRANVWQLVCFVILTRLNSTLMLWGHNLVLSKSYWYKCCSIQFDFKYRGMWSLFLISVFPPVPLKHSPKHDGRCSAGRGFRRCEGSRWGLGLGRACRLFCHHGLLLCLSQSSQCLFQGVDQGVWGGIQWHCMGLFHTACHALRHRWAAAHTRRWSLKQHLLLTVTCTENAISVVMSNYTCGDITITLHFENT